MFNMYNMFLICTVYTYTMTFPSRLKELHSQDRKEIETMTEQLTKDQVAVEKLSKLKDSLESELEEHETMVSELTEQVAFINMGGNVSLCPVLSRCSPIFLNGTFFEAGQNGTKGYVAPPPPPINMKYPHPAYY